MNDEQRKEIRQQFWDEDYFDGLPNRGELLKHFINEYGKTIERQQQAEIESLKNIVERFIADWTDGFRNYEYNSDEPEENKLRDDVFAILRKAQEK